MRQNAAMAEAFGTTSSDAYSDAALSAAVQKACSRIAPSWPLDRLIAVNPWWGFIEQPFAEAAHLIENLCPTRCTMPIAWFRERHAAGEISDAVLAQVLAEHGMGTDVAAFVEAQAQADGEAAAGSASWLVTDALDAGERQGHEPSWRGVVRHAIGQHCAMWFDRGQARWQPPSSRSMYASWRALASHDEAPSSLTGQPGISACIASLPATAAELLAAASAALQVRDVDRELYFTALLLDVGGWAGWCAYRRFQARQRGEDDASIEDLLAIRLAWEWVLLQTAGRPGSAARWADARTLSKRLASSGVSQARWIWQAAIERSWQETVHRGLAAQRGAALNGGAVSVAAPQRPALQAAFCIDVRSEPMRRALEACDPGIRTHGFAGFFGLPIAFRSLASSEALPQLPGPLSPSLTVIQQGPTSAATEELGSRRRARLGRVQAWQGFRTAASGGFGYVETLGLGYAWKLLRSSLGHDGGQRAEVAGLSEAEWAELHPAFESLSTENAVNLAAGVLGAMSLQGNFAPLVLLVGHGSASANNPHAHGLDCGACNGQSGQVNARTLAALLNDGDVRVGLAARGIHLPADTRFVGALHNTTTDEIRLFDIAAIEREQPDALRRARAWLDEAGERTRRERAATLGEGVAEVASTAKSLLSRLRHRAADWAQVRPEWGLANNAGFIAAPRDRTRSMNLGGRVFLHDYDEAADQERSVLRLILTAPVVVAHWISMQYYASTVDNAKWGCGNKVLHNVVGGDIGVFEGNGGDLRIGLPMQSLHDGKRWMHTPLRLSVWIEAPPEAIAQVVATEETVRRLVEGAWMHLFCIVPGTGELLRYGGPAAGGAAAGPWVQVDGDQAATV